MDFSFIERVIPDLAGLLNIQPSTAMLLWIMFSIACNVACKLIPDTATGWLGYVRKVCAIFGVYVQNRVAPGLTETQVVRDLAGVDIDDSGPVEYVDSNMIEYSEPEPTDPIEEYLRATRIKESSE